MMVTAASCNVGASVQGTPPLTCCTCARLRRSRSCRPQPSSANIARRCINTNEAKRRTNEHIEQITNNGRRVPVWPEKGSWPRAATKPNRTQPGAAVKVAHGGARRRDSRETPCNSPAGAAGAERGAAASIQNGRRTRRCVSDGNRTVWRCAAIGLLTCRCRLSEQAAAVDDVLFRKRLLGVQLRALCTGFFNVVEKQQVTRRAVHAIAFHDIIPELWDRPREVHLLDHQRRDADQVRSSIQVDKGSHPGRLVACCWSTCVCV